MPSGNPAVRAATAKSEWRSSRKDGLAVTLPSGNTAYLLRTLDLAEMIKEDKIPNPITGVMNKMLASGGKPTDVDASDPEVLISMIRFINEQCERIFVDPKVQAPPLPENLDTDPRCAEWDQERKDSYDINTWEPADPNVMTVLDIDFDDQMFAFAFAQGASADLATFRAERATLVAGRSDVETVLVPPVTTDGD